MAWDEQRARRAEQAQSRGGAPPPDAQATAPMGAAAGPPADRWWTVRPLNRHGWKVASALAVVAILMSGFALATSDDAGRGGDRDGSTVRMADHPRGGEGHGLRR